MWYWRFEVSESSAMRNPFTYIGGQIRGRQRSTDWDKTSQKEPNVSTLPDTGTLQTTHTPWADKAPTGIMHWHTHAHNPTDKHTHTSRHSDSQTHTQTHPLLIAARSILSWSGRRLLHDLNGVTVRGRNIFLSVRMSLIPKYLEITKTACALELGQVC